MSLTITDNGKDNLVSISARMLQRGSGRITIEGDNNVVKIADSDFNLGVNVSVGSGCSISIERNINCRNLFIHLEKMAHLVLGEMIGFNGLVRLQMHEPSRLSIGRGCLIADQVEISTSDMHSILDVSTKARVNPAKDINISDRVWIGQRSMVMKGTRIGSGCVIGAGSIVTSDLPPNCVAAGNPARVVRENSTWDFKLI